MRRLFVDGPLRVGSHYKIKGEEHRYLTKVLRHRVGDLVELRDEAGGCFSAKVLEVSRSEALLEASVELARAPSSWPLKMAVAVPKRQLMDDVVRKLSELGVERLIPCIAERSTVRPGENKIERWSRIAAESRRQCGRDVPLEISPVTPFAAVLDDLAGGGTRLVLHNAAERGFPAACSEAGAGASLNCIVGPEGGFTDGEIDLASSLGFEPVGLGTTVLRTETAAIAAAVLGLAALGAYNK